MKYQLSKPILAVGLLLTASQVYANLVITPNFDSSITGDPNAASIESSINQSIGVYESTFTNNINVSIDFTEISTGLGQSSFSPNDVSYADYRTALLSESSISSTIAPSLPLTNPVPGNSNAGVEATTPQLRALGFSAPGNVVISGQVFDSEIDLNTSIMNLSRTGPQDPNNYDIQGVVSHEIDEVLGLSSGLDGIPPATGDAVLPNVDSLDFYRYSAPGVRSFTSDPNAVSYFSLDGGVTPIVYFNEVAGGDRHDWASDGEPFDQGPEVQNAFGTPGVDVNLGPNEILALEAIGYNVADNVQSTPEPSALWGIGIGAMILVSRLLFIRFRRSSANPV